MFKRVQKQEETAPPADDGYVEDEAQAVESPPAATPPKIEKKPAAQPKPKTIIKVVKEIPMEEVREVTDEYGNLIKLITVEEALETIINT